MLGLRAHGPPCVPATLCLASSCGPGGLRGSVWRLRLFPHRRTRTLRTNWYKRDYCQVHTRVTTLECSIACVCGSCPILTAVRLLSDLVPVAGDMRVCGSCCTCSRVAWNRGSGRVHVVLCAVMPACSLGLSTCVAGSVGPHPIRVCCRVPFASLVLPRVTQVPRLLVQTAPHCM